jgi:PRTRC genetic system protein A
MNMTMLHPLDTVQQQLTPTVMVPVHSEFKPLISNGQRFLTAEDGLWMELRTPWLYLIKRISYQNSCNMPYGKLREKIEINFKSYPYEHIEVFEQEIINSNFQEIGGWITWSKLDGFRYYRLNVDHRKSDDWRYKALLLPEGEDLVFDLQCCGKRKPQLNYCSGEYLGGIHFSGAFGMNSKGIIEKRIELRVGKMTIPIGDIVCMLATQEQVL